MKLLLFRLDGPMQSWGDRSAWDVRDTESYPTKSGIIGVLSCCLGYQRDDDRIAQLCHGLKVYVRADKDGVLLGDYHTVQGMPKIASFDGTFKKSDATLVTRRYYLQDASFLVAISGEEGMLERCANGLRNPRWQPFLGRKSCIPAIPIIPIVTDEFTSVDDAFTRIDCVDTSMNGRSHNVIYESDVSGSEATRNDDIEDLAHRRFGMRHVRTASIKVEGGKNVFITSRT